MKLDRFTVTLYHQQRQLDVAVGFEAMAESWSWND